MRAAELHRLARDLRAIALLATENPGAARVNAGELAVLEDIVRNPGSTIAEITRRTGLAQSLVSRITRALADGGALSIAADAVDRRKVRIELAPATRDAALSRADNSISKAVATSTPTLSTRERLDLEHHLTEAERLLRADRDNRG